jgi:hypothetical protein
MNTLEKLELLSENCSDRTELDRILREEIQGRSQFTKLPQTNLQDRRSHYKIGDQTIVKYLLQYEYYVFKKFRV